MNLGLLDENRVGPRPLDPSLCLLRAKAFAPGAPRADRIRLVLAEFSIGCTCAHPDRPWDCQPCTEAAIAAIERAVAEP